MYGCHFDMLIQDDVMGISDIDYRKIDFKKLNRHFMRTMIVHTWYNKTGDSFTYARPRKTFLEKLVGLFIW